MAGDIQQIIATDFAYFRRWYDFSFDAPRYATPEILKKVFGATPRNVVDMLLTSPVTRADYRKQILSNAQLSCKVDYDISSADVRLAITDIRHLKQATLVAGAIYHYQDVIKVISKNDIQKLTESIGVDIYRFIVKRGVMLKKMIPDITTDTADDTIASKIATDGRRILCSALSGLPSEVHKRLEISFEEKLNIPATNTEDTKKKCFDLIMFSLEKAGKAEQNGSSDL